MVDRYMPDTPHLASRQAMPLRVRQADTVSLANDKSLCGHCTRRKDQATWQAVEEHTIVLQLAIVAVLRLPS